MTRVLIVDDSLSMRKILAMVLKTQPGFNVVGVARDAYEAREKILELKPDVITLDLEMPGMNGLAFLKKLMQHYPLPVVIISSFTPKGSELAIQALEAGAMEVIEKPGRGGLEEFTRMLADVLAVAAAAQPPALRENRPPVQPFPENPVENALQKLLVLGASTGGPETLSAIFRALPASTPGTLVVQHIPKSFVPPLARRLNEVSKMEVREARSGDRLRPGLALLSPGDRHLLVAKRGQEYEIEVKDGPKVFHQRPSVEVLFQSAARAGGNRAVGVILTGMGNDGATGLLAMRKAGAVTLAQDRLTSVVYGMPRAAAEAGAAQAVLPLGQIPEKIMHAFRNMPVE